MTRRAWLGCALLLFFLAPYGVLFSKVDSFSFPDISRVAGVFGLTLLQAGLSAATSLLIGIFAAAGILALPQRSGLFKAARFLILIPALVPTLFVLLATFNLLPSARGLIGVVFIHALINVGLVAIVIAHTASNKLGRLAESAWTQGSTRFHFLLRVAVPLLKTDLMRIGFFVFAVCMTSFAIPLVIGGSRFTTIEVLIYEMLRISLDWSQAVSLALCQAALILILSFAVRRQSTSPLVLLEPVPLLQWRPGLFFAFFPFVFVLFGLVLPLPNGLAHANELLLFVHGRFFSLLGGSIFTGVLTGVLVFCSLLTLTHVRPVYVQRRLLLGLLSPSSVLTGFALLIMWRGGGLASLFKISIGLTLIVVPAYYRLSWASLLDSLANQVITAEVLGARDWSITTRILFPQILRHALFLSGLSAFWAWGDFALSSVVGESSLTLAMVAQDLMSSYRLPAATLLVWIIVLGGGLTFSIFWGAGRVLGSKP